MIKETILTIIIKKGQLNNRVKSNSIGFLVQEFIDKVTEDHKKHTIRTDLANGDVQIKIEVQND